MTLAGRTVLVTGASRGIGRAIAEAVHAEGAHVVAHYGSDTQAAHALRDRLGDRVDLVRADLTDPGRRESLWQQALDAAGRIDVLVNNAGAWIASPLDDGPAWDDGWTANLALNLQAPADLCRLAIQHFCTAPTVTPAPASTPARGPSPTRGVIVNIASRSSHRGDDADHLAYGAAKGGLLALTKGIARGYARDGILAYAVAPGWVATDIAAGAGDELATLAAGLPLGEITPPQDVAVVVAFLASGRARHATGSTIDITGADYVR